MNLRRPITIICLAVTANHSTAQTTPPVEPKLRDVTPPALIRLPAPPAPAAAIPPRPVTAEEAARIALANQPSVTGARAAADAADGRAQQSSAGLRPTLGVAAGYSRTQTIRSDGTSSSSGGSTAPGYQATATVRQLLFDFDRTRALAGQSSALARAARANLTRAQADLVLQVKQAFYTCAQNGRLVHVNESNLRTRQSQLDLAEARLKSGLGLPIDVVRAQTAIADATFQLSLAHTADSTSRVALALLLGVDPRTPIQLAEADEPPCTGDDVNAMVADALTRRPEVAQAREALLASERAAASARTTDSPSLSASTALSTRGSDFPTTSDSWTVGIALQWTPFDAGLTAGRVREARANTELVRAQARAIELSVVSDVSQAYLSLRTAEQRIATADATVANAEESVRLAEGRYRAGVGTFIDVLDSQAALVTARTNRVNAGTAVDIARAAMTRAMGATAGLR